jgi:hypothetical protein
MPKTWLPNKVIRDPGELRTFYTSMGISSETIQRAIDLVSRPPREEGAPRHPGGRPKGVSLKAKPISPAR